MVGERGGRGEPSEGECAKDALLKASDFDIVQFGTQIFFGDEDDAKVSIGVMRLGSARERSKVSYFTVDGSAKAGEQYEHASGELVFEPGEKDASFDVPLIDDDAWHATNEFRVCLWNPENCILGQHLHTARVKVLDNNGFPSDKYIEQVKKNADSVYDISGAGLFWEYFKLNYSNDSMWWRTAVSVIIAQMSNIQLLLQTWMAMYMVDVVFNVRDADSINKLRFFSSRIAEAYLLAMLYVLPVAAVHLADYLEVKLDVEGHSTAFLRRNLVRRYFNLSESSLEQVDTATLQTAVMDETAMLASGYVAVLGVVKSMGTVLVLAIFTLHTNSNAWWIIVLLPSFMGLFLIFRIWFSQEFVDPAVPKTKLLALISEMLQNHKLIASFEQKPKVNDSVAKGVNRLREALIPEAVVLKHDEHMPKWIAGVFACIYVTLEAPAVLRGDGNLSLGTFLATIGIIHDFAGSFSSLYSVYLKVHETFEPVRHITWIFALKTDLHTWKSLTRARGRATKTYRQRVTRRMSQSQDLEKDNAASWTCEADKLNIVLESLCYQYTPNQPVISNANLTVPQGSIVAVEGTGDSGKAGLLQLLGQTVIPESGSIFIPGHLRIVQVEHNAMLFKSWSPFENLTFGIHKNDVDRRSMETILSELGCEKMLALIKDDLDKLRGATNKQSSRRGSMFSAQASNEVGLNPRWYQSLSHSELQKSCIARAFLANPEVLILHKPFVHFDAESKVRVMKAILAHVKNRGLGVDPETMRFRRPRTVFFSTVESGPTDLADIVWWIDASNHTVKVKRDFAKGSAEERHRRLFDAVSRESEGGIEPILELTEDSQVPPEEVRIPVDGEEYGGPPKKKVGPSRRRILQHGW